MKQVLLRVAGVRAEVRGGEACETLRADAALLRLLASALPLRGLARRFLRGGLRLRL